MRIRRTVNWILTLALVAGGIVLWLRCGRKAAVDAVYPVENAALKIQRNLFTRVYGFFHHGEVAAENERLRREVAQLGVYRQEAEQLRAENMSLRKMLGYQQESSEVVFIPAPILSRGGAGDEFQMLRLARGTRDGVAEGDTVLAPEGLVGRICMVTEFTSLVQLITDDSSHVAVEVVGSDRAAGRVFGILSGGGAQKVNGLPTGSLLYVVEPLRVRHLGRSCDPPPRSRIVTSGRGGVFPAGITVGYLLSTKPSESGLEREGEVVTAVDFAGLEDVIIRHAK